MRNSNTVHPLFQECCFLCCPGFHKQQILPDSNNESSVNLSECFDERQKLYLRCKTTTENTNRAVFVYDEKLYF